MKTLELQIKINNEQGHVFKSLNNKFSKQYLNSEEYFMFFEYKTFNSMIKAAKKLANENTEVIVYNKDGKGRYTTINKI